MRHPRCTAVVVTFIFAAMGPLGGTARAAFPGGDGKIAFEIFTNATARIYTMDGDGLNTSPLTPEMWDAKAPAWSSDGAKIAFVRRQPHLDQWALMTVRSDGSGLRTLLRSSLSIDSVAWSPDGHSLAYCAAGSANAVYTVKANGTGPTDISGAHQDCEPAWSPDGTTIAVETRIGRGSAWRLETINPDGTGRKVLVGTGINLSPDWSPDGSHLTFAGQLANGNYDIFTVNAGGGALIDITNSPNLNELGPAYSPTGTRIAYAETPPTFDNTDIWLENADGTGRPQLITDTPDIDELRPSWQPT